jgi:hypothetical protein
MNAYTFSNLMGIALRDSAAVKSFCISKWGRGALIQIDECAEKSLDSDAAPWINITVLPGSVFGVGAANVHTFMIGVGGNGVRPSAPVDQPWDPVITTARSATANGLQTISGGKDVADLLELVLAACGSSAIGAGAIMETASIDLNGFLVYPLQVAVAVVTVSVSRCLSGEVFA